MNPRWLVIVLVLTLSALAFGAVYPGRIVYWQEPERIEQFLVQATPLGASQADVQTWLEKQGVTAEIHKAAIPPNSDYRGAARVVRVSFMNQLHTFGSRLGLTSRRSTLLIILVG
jgi:hypothetical protein